MPCCSKQAENAAKSGNKTTDDRRRKLKTKFAFAFGRSLASLGLNQIDVASDWIVSYQYWQQGDTMWAVVGAGFIVVSGILSVPFHWFDFASGEFTESGILRKLMMSFLSLFQLHMFVESGECMTAMCSNVKVKLAELTEGGKEFPDLTEYTEKFESMQFPSFRGFPEDRSDFYFRRYFEYFEENARNFNENWSESADLRDLMMDQLKDLWQLDLLTDEQKTLLSELKQKEEVEERFCRSVDLAMKRGVWAPDLLTPKAMLRVKVCDTRRAISEKRQLTVMMKVLESVSESLPQGSFQTYVLLYMYYIRNEDITSLQVMSASISALSISLALTEAARFPNKDNPAKAVRVRTSIKAFILFFFDTALRILSLALFVAQLEFRPYSFIVLGGIVVLTSMDLLVSIAASNSGNQIDWPDFYRFWYWSFWEQVGVTLLVPLLGICGLGIGSFMVLTHAPLLFGLLQADAPEARPLMLRTWMHRCFDFLGLTGVSLMNRWSISDEKPVATLVCCLALFIAWSLLSVDFLFDPFLGYSSDRPQFCPDRGIPCCCHRRCCRRPILLPGGEPRVNDEDDDRPADMQGVLPSASVDPIATESVENEPNPVLPGEMQEAPNQILVEDCA